MNGNRGLWRIAGWLAVVHVVLMLGSFALQRVSPVGCINSVATPDVLICRSIEFVHPTRPGACAFAGRRADRPTWRV